MPSYFGNTEDLINWKSILESIKDKKGVYDIYNPELPYDESKPAEETAAEKLEIDLQNMLAENNDKEYFRDIVTTARKVLGAWWDVGYKKSEVYWEDFYAGEHFDITVQDAFVELTGETPIRVFITRLLPGKVAPMHFDVFPDLTPYQKLGEVSRYTCFVQEPQWGHVFAFKNVCYQNEPVGKIYKWDHVHEWHAAANMGLTPYYIFHFIGYK